MKSLISVDWGGTSFRAVQVDDRSELKYFRTSAVNIRTISETGLDEICSQIRKNFSNLENSRVIWLIGAAGAADEKAAIRVKERFSAIGIPGSECHLIPDYVANHAAVLGGQEGFLSINGTGSLLYVELNGLCERRGGWGFLLDESPSGAFWGRQTLKTVLEHLEGEDHRLAIAEEFARQHYQPDLLKILAELYQASNQQNKLGQFAEVLTRCYEESDEYAINMINTSIKVLVRQLKLLLEKIKHSETIPLSGCGGLWENWPLFHQLVSDQIKREGLPINVKKPIFKPIWGPMVYFARENKEIKKIFNAIPNKEKTA
ncbi:MAG: BadF/BadG/BcrA/BcrD ATPase family protein [Candidatus Rifleibacteriota bacterium]